MKVNAILWLCLVFVTAPVGAYSKSGNSSAQSRPATKSTVQTRPSKPVIQLARVVRPARIIVFRPRHSYGYYGYGYYGYSYGYYDGYAPGYYGEYHRSPKFEVKFGLDLIPKKERKMVQKGVVKLNGAEVGIVDNFTNGHKLSVKQGENEIAVILEDERVFQTTVDIGKQVITIYPRFAPLGSEKKTD